MSSLYFIIKERSKERSNKQQEASSKTVGGQRASIGYRRAAIGDRRSARVSRCSLNPLCLPYLLYLLHLLTCLLIYIPVWKRFLGESRSAKERSKERSNRQQKASSKTSAVSERLSAIGYRRSAISGRQSAIGYRLSANGGWRTVLVARCSFACLVFCSSLVVRRSLRGNRLFVLARSTL